MRHRCDGVIVKVESCHRSSGDSPRTSVLSSDGFQVRFEQFKGLLWIAFFDAVGRRFYQGINIDFGFRLFWYRFGFWLALLNFSEHVLLSHHHLSSALKFFNGERVVLIVIVMHGFIEQILWILNARFLGDFFHNGHVYRLGHFDRRLHRFDGDTNFTVLASLLKSDQSRVAGEERQCLSCHFVGTFQITNALE